MPYPEQHNLLTVHWSTPGAEVGQFGLRFRSASAPTLSDVQAAAGAVQVWWAGATGGVPNDYLLTFCRAARIGLDGNYVPGIDSVEYIFAPPVPGGAAAGASWPLQVAHVMTLLTAKPKGLAYKGRVYVPRLAYTLSAQHLFDVANVNTVVNTFSAMLSTLNGGPMGELRIFSKGNTAVPGGTSELVTGVQSDTRADVQRRRANQQTGVVKSVIGVVN